MSRKIGAMVVRNIYEQIETDSIHSVDIIPVISNCLTLQGLM